MNIILVRHGQTDWNKNGLLQGISDIELNSTGIEQAYKTKEILKDIDYDIIFSSPLKRAIDTAKIINSDKNKEVVINNKLLERGYGDLEGTKGTSLKKYWDLETNLSTNNVEPISLLIKRANSLLEELAENYSDYKNILVVSHNGFIMAMNSILSGKPFGNNNCLEFGLNNCEFKIWENV